MEVKWYSFPVLLVGVILSFADPITDILTLVEFYRTGHKTWFRVGLAFVILPCLFFVVLYGITIEFAHYTLDRKCLQTLLCGFHPFSAALRRLEGFLFYLKHCVCCKEIDSESVEAAEVNVKIISHVLFESVLEAAPQFVIQLYAANEQDESVKLVQKISLPVSFLSLVWAFTTVDVYFNERHGNGNARKVRYKIVLFFTQVLLLSGRLFAICYFTVGYMWYVLGVLFIHIFVLAITDIVCICRRGLCSSEVPLYFILLCCLNWLRDDISGLIQKSVNDEDSKKEMRRMQLFSNILFVLENIVMILLYYFLSDGPHSANSLYPLPVTVYVCVVSVIAAVTRVKLYHILYEDDETVNSELNDNNSQSDESMIALDFDSD